MKNNEKTIILMEQTCSEDEMFKSYGNWYKQILSAFFKSISIILDSLTQTLFFPFLSP